MAVAVVMNFAGATLDQYDEVMELMGLAHGGPAPDGALFHWVAQTDDGILVTDVWDTRERFDQFAQEKIGPHTQAVGFPGPPEMTYHDVHNTLAG